METARRKMTVIMLDTCIYLNYYLDESGRFIDFGEEARLLINMVKEGKYKLIVSDHLDYQIKNKLGQDYSQYETLKEEVKRIGCLIEVKVEQSDKQTARTYNTEFEDALHYQLARKGGANILVTRNIEDYKIFDGMHDIKIRYPEHVGVF